MSANSLDPTNVEVPSCVVVQADNDDSTVIISNTTKYRNIQTAIAAAAKTEVVEKSKRHTHKIIDKSKAFADTGATAIFVMEDVPVDNKREAMKPLTINLPDGTKVKSTHECDITIPGLPKVLTGHIVPQLKIASLIPNWD